MWIAPPHGRLATNNFLVPPGRVTMVEITGERTVTTEGYRALDVEDREEPNLFVTSAYYCQIVTLLGPKLRLFAKHNRQDPRRSGQISLAVNFTKPHTRIHFGPSILLSQ